jgi:hypothetical protein
MAFDPVAYSKGGFDPVAYASASPMGQPNVGPQPPPVVANPLTAIGGVFKNIWNTAAEQPENPLTPTWGGQLHNLGQAASVVGQTMALPFSIPLAALAGAFPRATQAITNAPMQAVDPYSGQVIGGPGPSINQVGQAYNQLPQPVKDVANIASLVPVGRIFGPMEQAGMRAAGEQLIKPKVRSIVSAATDVAADRLGATTREQTANAARIISENGLHNSIGDPEILNQKATDLGDKYSSAAFQKAVENLEFPTAGNPVAVLKQQLSDQIANQTGPFKNLPMDKIALFQKTLDKMADSWTQTGYDKDMPNTGIISFKRNLGTNWKQGTEINLPIENATNAIRKAAYFAADNLITDPEVKVLNDKASDLYSVAGMAAGQKTQPFFNNLVQNLTPSGAAFGAMEALNKLGTAHAGEMAIPAAIAGGLYSGVKSGIIGRMLLTGGRLGMSRNIPEGMSPKLQSAIRAGNLSNQWGGQMPQWPPGPPLQLPYKPSINLPNMEGPVKPGTYVGPGSPPEAPMAPVVPVPPSAPVAPAGLNQILQQQPYKNVPPNMQMMLPTHPGAAPTSPVPNLLNKVIAQLGGEVAENKAKMIFETDYPTYNQVAAVSKIKYMLPNSEAFEKGIINPRSKNFEPEEYFQRNMVPKDPFSWKNAQKTLVEIDGKWTPLNKIPGIVEKNPNIVASSDFMNPKIYGDDFGYTSIGTRIMKAIQEDQLLGKKWDLHDLHSKTVMGER